MANTFIQLPIVDVAVTAPISVSVDKLKIWDGSDILGVNTDGSINTKSAVTNNLEFSEVAAVVSSLSYTTILTKVCVAGTIVYSYEAAGSNVAEFIVRINGNIVDHKWSNLSNYTVSGSLGPTLASGDTVQIQVRHSRPTAGDFSAKLFYGN